MAIRARIFWHWMAILAVAFLILGALLFALREPILRRLAQHSIEKNTGLRAEIGELRSAFGSSAFEVRDLTLYNLKEFGGSLFARIPVLLVDLDSDPATRGILRLRKLQLHLAELHVVKDHAGRFNVDGIEKSVREQFAKRFRLRKKVAEFQFGGIDHLELTLRQVRYTPMARPEQAWERDLHLENEVVTTLKTEEDLQTWIGAVLFRILLEQSVRKQDARSDSKEPPPQPAPTKPAS